MVEFDLAQLEGSIISYFKNTINVKNACMIYESAIKFSIKKLQDSCLFLDFHAQGVLRQDSFCKSEINIFKAFNEWVMRNPGEDINDIISVIQLPLISNKGLLY